MKAKNVFLTTLSLLLVGCGTLLPTINQHKDNTFRLMSTVNPDEIKKVFLSTTRILKTKKDEDEKARLFTFSISTQNDSKRSYVLNLINGPDGLNKVGNLEVKINGKTIIQNHDEDINDTTDINKITKKICDNDKKYRIKSEKSDTNDNSKQNKDGNDDKVKSEKDDNDAKNCDVALTNFFNRRTDSLSVALTNLKVGSNTLSVRIKDERANLGLDVSIDGFLRPMDIHGAIFSNIDDEPLVRQAPYIKGRIGIKFLEGMKVKLLQNPDGTKKLVDQNGTSLTVLERLMTKLKVKSVNRAMGVPVDELEQLEIKTEAFFGNDAPNLNLFYFLEVDENLDLWPIIDQIRQLPFIEESFPEFIGNQPGLSMPTDEELEKSQPFPDNYQNDEWLKVVRVKSNSKNDGAWSLTKGKPDVKVAIVDWGFFYANSHITSDAGSISTTHPDLVSAQNPPRIEYIDNMSGILKLTNGNINHGTESAGIAGAEGENGIGVAGVAYKSGLMMITSKRPEPSACLGANGITPCDSFADSMYLAFKKGAKVIVPEFENFPLLTAEQDNPIIRAVISGITASGAIVVIPAGNSCKDWDEFNDEQDQRFIDCKSQYLNGRDIRKIYIDNKAKVIDNNVPNKVPGGIFKDMPDTGSIIVGGLQMRRDGGDISDRRRHFLLKNGYDNIYYNYGKSASGGTNDLYTSGGHGIDISAPADVLYTTAYPPSTKNQTDLYVNFGGTSGASPLVGGICALMLSKRSGNSALPAANALEIRKILRKTEQYIDPGEQTAGMVDAYRAVQDAAKITPLSKIDATSVYGLTVGTFSANLEDMLNYSGTPVKAPKGGFIGIALAGNTDNATASVDGISALLIGSIDNLFGSLLVFAVPNNISYGIKDVAVSTDGGKITYPQSLEVTPNANQGDWTLKLFNSDDFINSYLLNGTSLLATNNGEVREQNITSLLPSGNSQFQFDVENFGSGMTWGVELKKGNQVILRDVRGKYGSFGADNNSNYFSNYTSEYSINIPINKENGLLLPSSDWKIKLFNVSPGDTLNVYRYSNNSWVKIASSSDSNNLKLFRLSTFFNLATEKLMLEVVNPSGSYSYGFSLLRDGDEVYRNVVGDKYWGASENYPYTDNQNKTGTFSVKQTGSNKIELETSLELSYDQAKPLTMSQAPFPDGTVTFNGGISIPREKFIDNEPFTKPIQANRNDVLGVALDGVNSLSDVVITIDGKQVTIQDIVNEYIAFKVPPDVSDGVKDIIIKKVNGSKTLTFAQTLEILASQPKGIIVFSSNQTGGGNNSGDIYSIKSDGTERIKIISTYAEPAASPILSSLSPNGRQIAYSKQISGIYQPFISNLDGSNEQRLVNDLSYHYLTVDWHPTQNKILISKYNTSFNDSSIYTVNTDSSNLTLIYHASNTFINRKSFNPDGSKIVFSMSTGSFYQLYTINTDGTGFNSLVNSAVTDGRPFWARDNSGIYFFRTVSGYKQIFKCNIDGSNVTQITTSSIDKDYPVLSPDGLILAFSGIVLDKEQIFTHILSTGIETNISNNSFNDSIFDWR